MTQKQKVLLLKDLCARLPYGVKLQKTYNTSEPAELYSIDLEHNTVKFYKFKGECLTICDTGFIERYEKLRFKPYLFPLSSMTKEQEKEWRYTLSSDGNITYDTVDWCNENHFDYRGLIPMDLAIDATGLNIY